MLDLWWGGGAAPPEVSLYWKDKEKESLIDEKIIRIHFCCFYKREYVGSESRFQILMIISELVKTFVARAWLKLVSMLLS